MATSTGHCRGGRFVEESAVLGHKPLLGNGFPIAQEGAVRPSLENMGKILDNGWSVLIYPEGELTVGGPIRPFMNGTGMVAVEG